jgi:hypothetical protein
MQDDIFGHHRQRNRIVLTGLSIGALYWVAQSCMEAVVLNQEEAEVLPAGYRPLSTRAILIWVVIALASLALFDRERANILAGQAWAAAHAEQSAGAARRCRSSPSSHTPCPG